MRAYTQRFEVVQVTGTRRWKDAATGKPRQLSKKFMQTLNPWNKAADGSEKTRNQIWIEILAERDAWLAEAA